VVVRVRSEYYSTVRHHDGTMVVNLLCVVYSGLKYKVIFNNYYTSCEPA
jgi:hypothetical protein